MDCAGIPGQLDASPAILAPLITRVPPHLLALSTDPRAADMDALQQHGCQGLSQLVSVWGVIYFPPRAPLHGRAAHMEGRNAFECVRCSLNPPVEGTLGSLGA